MIKKQHFLSLISLTVFGLISLFLFHYIPQSTAAGTLDVFPSNSRLSFRGVLDTGNTADTSIAYIQTTPDATAGAYSTTSAQLIPGDSVVIGSGSYTVAVTSANLPDNQIALASPLIAADVAADTIVYTKSTGPIRISMTPQAGVTNGSFMFIFPAVDDTVNSNDGLPDTGAYDFNNSAAITCPTVDGNYTAWTSAAVPAEFNTSSVSNNTVYHAFTCSYTGTSTGDPLVFTVSNLLNPAPLIYDTGHPFLENRTIGSMEALGVFATQFDNVNAAVLRTSSYVGYGSSVKMTVRVLPQLTFTLDGISEGTSVCSGLQANVTSTGVTVPFGSISNTNFTDAAQKMSVTTNAANGYIVTAIANDQMGLSGNACPGDGDSLDCIPGYSDATTTAPWAVADGRGFGYTLNLVSGDTYLNGSTPNATVAFNSTQGWRAFADRADGDQPIQLVNNLRSTNGDVIDVCYRIMSDATNMPGDYQSTITYTVTASF